MKQYIYGKNPIMEALKGASVYKIYMLNGHKDPKIFDICKRNQIPLEFVDIGRKGCSSRSNGLY